MRGTWPVWHEHLQQQGGGPEKVGPTDCGVLRRLRWLVGLLSFVLLLACEKALTRGVAGAQSPAGVVPRAALMSASTA